MVKIEYNENNKEEKELIEDYYFYKNYINSIRFDWQGYYFDEVATIERIKIIINHQNQTEFLRFCKIHFNITNPNCQFQFVKCLSNYQILLSDIFFTKPEKIFKKIIINRFNTCN